MSDPQEKRRYPRARIRLPVVVDTAKGFITGETVDIGVGGAFISCLEALEPNQIFNLAMVGLPLLDCRLVVTAQVVWSNIQRPDDELGPHSMGIQFIRISNEDRKYISAVVSAYLAGE